MTSLKTLSRYLVRKHPFALALFFCFLLLAPTGLSNAAELPPAAPPAAQCTLQDLDTVVIQIRCHMATTSDPNVFTVQDGNFVGPSYQSPIAQLGEVGGSFHGRWGTLRFQEDGPGTWTGLWRTETGQPHGYSAGTLLNINVSTYNGGPQIVVDAVELTTEGGWPDDWYPGGVPGGAPVTPATACRASTVTPELTINGETIPFLGIDSYTVKPTDELQWSITVNEPDEFSVQSFRFRNNPTDTFRLLGTPSGVDGMQGQLETVRWSYDTFSVDETQSAGLLEIRCAPSFQLGGTRFLHLDTLAWEDFPRANSICSATQIGRPSGGFEAGDDVQVSVTIPDADYVNGDEGLASLSVDLFNVSGLTPVTDFTSHDRYGAQVGGPPPELFIVPKGIDGFLRFTVPWDGTFAALEFRCSDSSGSDIRITGSGNYFGTNSTGVFDYDAGCIAGNGMTLDPRTWPGGFLPMIGCAAQDLVVPHDGFMATWVEEEADRWSNEPPFILLAAGVEFGQETHAALVDPTGTGCFDVEFTQGPIAGAESCIGEGISSGGHRPLLAVLMIAPLILGVISHSLTLVKS